MSRLPNATTVLNGTVANVYEDQLGAVLTVTANVGDTTITVDDTAEFDGDQGGSVQVAGTVYTYTAVDDETGIVTLGTTLTTGADEGDAVQIWDTSTDSAAFELRALVNLPGTDANGEAIDAAIRHNLQPLLAEGIREPLKGESVEMNLIGDEWMVVDIYGKKAKIQPAFAAGGAIAASGYFTASDTSAFTGAAYRVPFDTDGGSDPGVFTIGTSPNWDVTVVADGFYDGAAQFYITGADPGDVFRALMQPGSAYLNNPAGFAIADSGGAAHLTVASDVDFNVGGVSGFNVSVEQISGTGTTPAIVLARLKLTKFSS